VNASNSNPNSDPNPNSPAPAPKPRYTLLWISLVVLSGSLLVLRAAMAAQGDGGAPAADAAAQSLWTTVGIWTAAILTIGVFSFLYRDNPLYKVCESVLIGVSAAYWMVNGFWTSLVPQLFGKLMPGLVREYALPAMPVSATPGLDFALACVPLVLGIMLVWRLAPKGGWISVWPIAMIIGVTAGLKLVSSIESDFMAQLGATMRPLVAMNGGFDFWGTIAALVGVVGVLTVLTYFFFSVEHKGAVGKTARVGVWFLMITFGSAFGLTVMGRITLLAQRFEFLFKDWLHIG
jgi:hypothetical protein